MADTIYKKLSTVLDTLPNGFPSTASGVEIKLLKKIFTPDQAELLSLSGIGRKMLRSRKIASRF